MVLVPAGPHTPREYLDDTIESINHHIGPSNCIVAVIDDSRQGRFARAGDVFPNVVVMEAADYQEGSQRITRGALFCKQIQALKHLVRHYRFDVLLRMDTDALMIGDAPHEDVLAFMKARPDVGMVGAFKRRGDGSDKTAALAAKGRQLTREMSLSRAVTHPGLVRTLRFLVRCAEKHGYVRGDMCTGGAVFLAPHAIAAMHERGLLDLDGLQHCRLMDDALLALLCYASGYRLADLPDERDVLAITWRGLPMPVGELVAKNKKIVHPVKDEDAAVEPAIRAFFQARRAADLEARQAADRRSGVCYD